MTIVILRSEVPGLGNLGDTVKVKDGFARNYLLPKGLAVPSSPANLAMLENEKRTRQRLQGREYKTAQELAEKIKSASCTIAKKVGENDKLFGSVTSTEIIECLQAENIQIAKKQVILEEPIRTLGIYPVLIKLHPEIEVRLKVWVVKA